MKRFGLILGLCVIFGGCATTSLQTKASMSQSIFIDPVKKTEQSIFIASRNTSGQEVNLQPKIEQMLKNKGYRIVSDPNEATFILQTNVLYCNIKQESNALGGGVIGGVVGAGVGGYNHDSATQTAIGGLVGATLGALAGKLTEDTIFQMQVDINLRQRIGKVEQTQGLVSSKAHIIDGNAHGLLNGFGGPKEDTQGGSRLSANQQNYQSQRYETKYSQKESTLLAEATKLNLDLKQAIPILEDQIARQISGIF